jgi:hypothetical protein
MKSSIASSVVAPFVAVILSGCADATPSSSSSSLGDRLVLEVHYTQQYQELPLTAQEAQAVGWNVSDKCVPGFGRRAQSDSYLDLWDGRHGALHLWYDRSGSVMGFGVSAASGVAAPWRLVDDHYEIDFLTRDPESACGEGPSAVAGSVGDRLLLVDASGELDAMPLTLQGAFDEKFNDGGPCFPEMGWHMMYNRHEVSSPTPVYSGADGSLLAMNLNSYVEQQTPSFEYPAPKEGKAVYGWHVYFKDHKNVCDGAPTAYALPFAETPADKANTDFACTPYFGNLWVQTLTTVVDVDAPGSVCKDADDCKFVHFMGPQKGLGSGTLCVPPELAKEDGCHCYHQVTYTQECEEEITSSHSSGSVDTSDAFDDDGVLKACADHVVLHSVVGWRQTGNLEPCDCEGIATVQV